MVNTRVKGRKAEKELQAMLQSAGWDVLLTDMPKSWKKEQDFFSLFDIIAVKDKYVRYIQVKCNRKPPLRDYTAWGKAHPNPYCTVEVWVRKDRQGWFSHLAYVGEQIYPEHGMSTPEWDEVCGADVSFDWD